jgi:hypothetical protein
VPDGHAVATHDAGKDAPRPSPDATGHDARTGVDGNVHETGSPDTAQPPHDSAVDGGADVTAPPDAVATTDAHDAATPGPTIALTGPATIATYTCPEYTATLDDAAALPADASAPSSVTLGGLGAGAAYASLASCQAGGAGVTSIAIAMGTSSASFFYRTAAAGPVTLTAAAHDFATGSLPVTVNAFDVLGQPDLVTNANVSLGISSVAGLCIAGGKLFEADNQNNRVLVWNTVPTATGTPPDFALGQPSLDTIVGNQGMNTPTASSMYYPYGCTTDGTRLFVVDNANNRVLVWNSIPTMMGQAADYVIGQSSMTVMTGGTTATSMSRPSGVYFDGTRLFVVDQSNNRVLGYNTVPTASGAAASFVLGQADFTHGSANEGGAVSASSMKEPAQVAGNGTELLVSDYANNRVLVWSTTPSTNNAPASFALGQADLVSSSANGGGAVSASTFHAPDGLTVAGGKLLVTDADNYRLLVWDTLPASSQVAANLVLGQPNFTTSVYNNGNGTPSATNVGLPVASIVSGNSLLVADLTNGRVLGWDTFPTTNGQAADFALGKKSFTVGGTDHPTMSGATLAGVTQVKSAGAGLLAADSTNNRILLWSSLPVSNDQPADLVVGQPDMVSFGTNTGGISASTLNGYGTLGATSDGKHLVVADSNNQRVLIWNSIPTTNGAPADVVLGQTTFTTGASAASASAATLSYPTDVATDGKHLFVADSENSRVLVWNTIPTANDQPADLVLGQSSFSATVSAAGAQGLSYPSSVATDGVHLVVADSENARVLVWNTIPTTNQQPADLVLGQTSFTSHSGNQGLMAPTASTLAYADGVSTDGTRLFVADTSNERVLVWSAFPTMNDQPATGVLGQAGFTTSLANVGADTPSASGLYSPQGAYFDGIRVFIADALNNRVVAEPLP